jgi:uncharacterized protein YutE (UPF0331/DUF86 family)
MVGQLRRHRQRLLHPTSSRKRATSSKFRNLIARAYGDVDPNKLFLAATAGIGQFKRFLAEIGAWVTARSGDG